MKHLLTIFAVLLAAFTSFSQDSVVVNIEIKNSRYDDPVRNADVIIETSGDTLKYRTNSYGDVFYTSALGVSTKFTLEHFKYHNASFERRIPSKKKKDTITYTFELDYIRTQTLGELIATAPGTPIVQYGSRRLHVSDFEIMENGNLLLLTYPKRLKKGSELLIWNGQRAIASFKVESEAEELVRDFRGNPHVVCEDAVYAVYANDESVGLANIDRDYFTKFVVPIVDTNKSKLYFSNFNKFYPAFDYFSYDRIDSAYTKILEIEDELMMELYRAEYKWVDVRTKLWAKNKEIQTGVDAEIWVGMNYFTQSIYYKELYAPLFHRNDTLFIFDYYKDYLRTFDDLGNPLDSIPIYHHYDTRTTGWESNLIQDRKTGQIYALYERDGYTYIGWVNTNTGEINEQVKLEFRYAHSVQVHGNHVYYIYRPYESPQKKFLYKERLPYDFGGAKIKQGELMAGEGN
ncbi:MAG: hypothetical protein QNK23_18555 [Crocinitomicaceae bacterium]|nr:hypothetical protein [Crocinitomicaceae bacterium]